MAYYKYLAVDAQSILYKAFAATKGLGHFNSSFLQLTFFRSIKKILIELDEEEGISIGKVLLLWDKRPYYRASLVDDYKGTRTYYTEDDLELDWDDMELSWEDVSYLLPGKSPNDWSESDLSPDVIKNLKLDKLRRHKEHVAREIYLFEQFGQAKYNILVNFSKVGLPSIIREGFEADDIAYTISRTITDPVLLCTVDSDWLAYITTSTHYWQPKRQELTTYSDVCQLFFGQPQETNITVHEFKSYMDSLQGNHNDLESCITDEADELRWVDLIPLIKSNGPDQYVTDKKLFSQNFSTFQIETFPNYNALVNDIKQATLAGDLPDTSDFAINPSLMAIPVPQGEYSVMSRYLNKELFNGN